MNELFEDCGTVLCSHGHRSSEYSQCTPTIEVMRFSESWMITTNCSDGKQSGDTNDGKIGEPQLSGHVIRCGG